MATRSRIGIKLKDGSILSVYHHWNGYPEWLGRILNTHFNTEEKVQELIDGGDMSLCWTDERWDNPLNEEYGPQYYSQRGEDCPPRLDPNMNLYLKYGEEYAYVFINNEWVCYDLHDENPKMVEIPNTPLAV